MEIQYQHLFDLKAEELKLRILNCSKEKIENNPNVNNVEPSELIQIGFPDQSFDLALCANVLFTESDKLSEAFHLVILLELVRVATEVRIYPLIDKNGRPSVHLGPILQSLQEKGYGVELRQVTAKAQDGSALLRIWNESCVLN